jgi:uncharacterized SAM-binding protein YcdF (DUF218 family)
MITSIITLLLSPLGSSLLLGGAALLLLRFVRDGVLRRVAWGLALFAFAWLWLWSMPVASEALRGRIEAAAGPRALEEVAPAEVAVVLGGGVSGPRAPLRLYPDLGAAADRVWYAAQLYKTGKVRRVVLSGGVVETGDGSEADAMRRFLRDLGVPAQAIVLEPESVNTRTNASFTRELLAGEGQRRIVLVTSALHMPRARRMFERAGFEVLAAPTDFEVIDMPFTLLRLLPNAEALAGSARALKELAGYVVAR